jgi:glycosyltransferase involved in cell wall biosynthesis
MPAGRRVAVIGSFAPSLIKFRGPLIAAMVERGHQVTALAPDPARDPAAREAEAAAGPGATIAAQLAAIGAAFAPFELDRAGLDPLADAQTVVSLVRRLRALRVDLSLGYTIKPVIYGSLAARLAGVRHRAAMITGLGTALAGGNTPKQQLIAALARRLYRGGLALCEAVIFQNTDDRDELARIGALRASTRVAIVRGSGVDLAHYAPSPLPPGPPVFVFVGRLLRSKGIHDYVAAARTVRARIPAARFRVVGWLDPNPDSLNRRELDAVIADGTVEYLGPADDVRPHIAAAHVLVLPSYGEGTPRAVLEAMSMQRAVITTDAPGCRDTVVDGDSGLIVPVRDPAALAKAMLLLATMPALLGQLADAARTRAVELYDARAVARDVLAALGL